MAAPTYKLNNGLEVPAIAYGAPSSSLKCSKAGTNHALLGIGTWQSPPEELSKAVEFAIKEAGYRHIDCAWGYRNEKAVGEGIKASGIPRSELFVR